MTYYLLYDPTNELLTYLYISSADNYSIYQASDCGWTYSATQALSSPLSASRAEAGCWYDLTTVLNQFSPICQSSSPITADTHPELFL